MATTTLLDIPTRTTVSATADCTTAVPGEYGSVPPGSCNSYYAYDPSFGGNLAFAVLFGIVTFIHVIEAIIFKKVRFDEYGYVNYNSSLTEVLLGHHHGCSLGVCGFRHQDSRHP